MDEKKKRPLGRRAKSAQSTSDAASAPKTEQPGQRDSGEPEPEVKTEAAPADRSLGCEPEGTREPAHTGPRPLVGFLPPLAPDPYSQEYRLITDIIQQHTWIGVLCVIAATTVAAYGLDDLTMRPYLAMATVFTLVVVSNYVVSPNHRLGVRYLFSSVVTLVIAIALTQDLPEGLVDFEDWVVGLALWTLILYWLAASARWASSLYRVAKGTGRTRFFGTVLTVWGLGLQIALLLGALLMPLLNQDSLSSNPLAYLRLTLDLADGAMILRLVPIALLLTGFTVFVLLRLKARPWRRPPYDRIWPKATGGIRGLFAQAIKPVILPLTVLLSLLDHFSELARETIRDFARLWALRTVFLILALVLGPLCLLLGHAVLFWVFADLSSHVASGSPSLGFTLVVFVRDHGLLLFALFLYVSAASVLSLPFRGNTSSSLLALLRVDFPGQGGPVFEALTSAYALVLFVALLAIPLATLFPGRPAFGVFSTLYAALVILSFLLKPVRRYAGVFRNREGAVG